MIQSPATYIDSPQLEESFSYVQSLAKGGFTFGPNDTAREKTIVIAMWFFSIITCGLLPSVAFLVCWVKDVVDMLKPPPGSNLPPPEPLKEDEDALLALENLQELPADEEALTENPTVQLANEIPPPKRRIPNLLAGVAKFMPDIRTLLHILANGGPLDLNGLQKSESAPLDSVAGRLEEVEPFQLFTAILSEKAMVDNLDKMAKRPNIVVYIPFVTNVNLNLLEKFCKDIQEQRENMGEEIWQERIAGFEAFCNIEAGVFASLDTRTFIRTVIERRDELHQAISERKAAALARASTTSQNL